MKIVSTTTVLISLCCATSAFGLHGRATSALKKTSMLMPTKQAPAMVQPVDLRGNRVSETVRRILQKLESHRLV